MIAFVEGQFIHKSPANTIVNVNGVGYDVQISIHTFDKIQNLTSGRLYTYLKISEDNHSLYGFFEEYEKSIFLNLISISGVGAGTARMMLSGMQASEIVQAIVNGDVKSLERIKGIGAKTAQRIVLELRDKLSKTDMPTASQAYGWAQNNIKTDTLNALMSLGIARPTAAAAIDKALKQQPDVQEVQALIKLALKNI
jgi:holliday junction DNA helicase RuvA